MFVVTEPFNCDDDRKIHGTRCFDPYIPQAGLQYRRSVSLFDAVLLVLELSRIFCTFLIGIRNSERQSFRFSAAEVRRASYGRGQ